MFAYMLCTVARRFTVGLVNNASTILQHSDQPRYLIQSPSLCDNQFVLALFCIEPGCLFEAATIIIEIHIFRVLQNRLSRASAVTEIWDLAARRIQCARALTLLTNSFADQKLCLTRQPLEDPQPFDFGIRLTTGAGRHVCQYFTFQKNTSEGGA